MPKGELKINGKDAFTEWGISMDTSSLSALMTPAPLKDLVKNSSNTQHGSRPVSTDMYTDERTLSLTINLTAKNEDEFFSRYLSFCDELYKGKLNIETKYQPGVIYKTYYQSCSQFTQFMRGIASYSLKLLESNCKDRS
jgi:hypothetical protein